MSKDVVIPKGMEVSYERFHFAPAVRDGDRLFCSGQIGTGPDGRTIEDPKAQFTAAFEHVRTVLEAAGAGLEDILEMTTYHVDMQAHLGTFMQVKDDFIEKPYPAWTAIGTPALAMPGGLVEIRVIAKLSS